MASRHTVKSRVARDYEDIITRPLPVPPTRAKGWMNVKVTYKDGSSIEKSVVVRR